MVYMRLRPIASLSLLYCFFAFSAVGQVKETKPEYPNVEIQVTYLKGGELKNFTTDASVAAGSKATFRCGRAGSVCEITWTFMERSEFGDIYKFSRIFPQAKDQQSSQREVLYMGRETFIWQDEEQRITIKPRPATEQ